MEEGMKKLVVLIFMVLFLVSCGQSSLMSRSEFLQHDTMYKNWDHMKFSWFGPDKATSQDLEESNNQQWWGLEVPYVPGQ
jgi:hypothetical protein